MASLLNKSDARRGESFGVQVLYRKIAQVVVDQGVAIKSESPTTDARQAFAVRALTEPDNIVNELMPYVIQNPVVADSGGDVTDNDILFVLTNVNDGVINALYPPA